MRAEVRRLNGGASPAVAARSTKREFFTTWSKCCCLLLGSGSGSGSGSDSGCDMRAGLALLVVLGAARAGAPRRLPLLPTLWAPIDLARFLHHNKLEE
eukprot:COSAG04_NODE_17150_length_477_cov_1.764550_1_plen_97_part_01